VGNPKTTARAEQLGARGNPNLTASLILLTVLAIAFAVQTAHYIEHITQLYQIYEMGMKPAQAHGLLGSVFDFEWVHFLYNIALEAVLIRLWFGYRSLARTDSSPDLKRGVWVLGALVVFQGYHTIEHIVKLYQFLSIPLYQSGQVPTPGILPTLTGWPPFLVHFWLNTIVWVMLLVVLWYVRPRTTTVGAHTAPI
jgi:hypothetical protein